MKKITEPILIFGLLALLILIFWSPALLPGKALFLRDLCLEIIPYRSFWVRSSGFALWDPFDFFGMPYAANPQSGVFYPLNLVFFLNPIWRGLIGYIILHYLIAAASAYLLFRELEFSRETSFFASIAFCLSGIFSSLSNLIVLFSVASWLCLSGWLLVRSLKSRWLTNILFLALVFALQFLAGDPHLFGESLWICLALGIGYLVGIKAGKNLYLKLFSGFGLALLIGLILSSPQIFLTLEMFPFSNRAPGYGFENFSLWSLIPGNLLTLFFPNYFLPPESGLWLLGFFFPLSYLLSLYPGILVLFLAVFSLRENKRVALWWAMIFLVGIFFSLGRYNPFYRSIFEAIPFLRFFRFPEKFYLISGFSLVILAALGLEGFLKKPLKIKTWYPAFPAFLVSLALLAAFLLLREREFPLEQAHQSLILASAVRSLSLLFAGLAWILLSAKLRSKRVFALGIILLAYFDLAYAHFRLNPAADSRFYTETPEGISRIDRLWPGRKEAGKIPLRIAVIHPGKQQAFAQATTGFEYFVILREWLNQFWGVYYGVNDVLAKGSFYLSEIDDFHRMVKSSPDPEQILARGGVRLIYRPEALQIIPEPLPRAMIFYQAEVIPDPDNLTRLWLSPQFPFREKILLETDTNPMPASSSFPAEPAEIVGYENQKVEIKLNARAQGWLLLLDTYYPGWRAYLDGREVRIYRANRFFRAIPIPAGEHRVIFRYLPKSLIYGIILAGAGFLAWIFALVFSWRKWKK